jgi:Tfp pilus assembly protein PilP
MLNVLVLSVLSLVPQQTAGGVPDARLSRVGVQEKPQQPPVSAPLPTPSDAATTPYSYNPEGRRDPFVSLLGRGNDPRQSATKVPGVPGLLISEVTVKGIVRDRSGFLAMVQSSDNKTYIVRPGDKLFDGTVKSIMQDSVVFSQDVSDPLSLVKQREVLKRVRATETPAAAASERRESSRRERRSGPTSTNR